MRGTAPQTQNRGILNFFSQFYYLSIVYLEEELYFREISYWSWYWQVNSFKFYFLGEDNDVKQTLLETKIEILFRLGRVDEAQKESLKIYGRLLKKNGGRTNAIAIDRLFKFGKRLHQEGYYNKAVQYLEKVCLNYWIGFLIYV